MPGTTAMVTGSEWINFKFHSHCSRVGQCGVSHSLVEILRWVLSDVHSG